MNAALSMTGLILLLAADPTGPALRGTVQDTDGKPVAGARVDIATAAPRVGQGLFCPSCYSDCTKSTRTDAHGRFEIGDLDPSLKFTLLVSTPGKKASHTGLVDPLLGEANVRLDSLPAELPIARTVQGRLINDRGEPIAGALVEPLGAQTPDRRWWGRVDVDPTVSDSEGQFSLVLPEGFQGVDVRVTAQGYAGASVALVKPGPEWRQLTIPAGTRVTGRLVRDGRPATGLRLAVVQMERTAGHHFIKAVGAVTDADGKFAFDRLPANEDYAIYTLVGAGPQEFVITTKKFKAHGDRQARDLGDLSVIPARRITGRLQLAVGESLPPNTRITLGRDPAWDLIAVPVAPDGWFTIGGLPPETYEVRVAAQGFQPDGSRLPYQIMRGGAIGLRLRDSVEELDIPLVRPLQPGGQP
jgi:hypothetical protein